MPLNIEHVLSYPNHGSKEAAMNRILFVILCAMAIALQAGHPARGADIFGTFFTDATMRIDYYHLGDAASETVTLDRVYREKGWSGSTVNLIDETDLGKYRVKVYDAKSRNLLFSRYYNSIFEEYQTTDPAAKGIKRSFEESALIPFPKETIIFALESRGKDQVLREIFRTEIDPHDIYIATLSPDPSVEIMTLLESGDPHQKVDLSIVADGYTREDRDKFAKDSKDMAGLFFSMEPYKSHKTDFNIRAIFKPSRERGCTEPGFDSFKDTAVGCSFDSLGSERYLLTEKHRELMNVTAHAPCDTMIILANTTRYGGGGIYNFYATSIADNQWRNYVFLHEFGHSFAGLADEYYTSKVEYNDFYPKSIEPLSPNLTALRDPATLKWKDMLSTGIKLPTPWDKKTYDENDISYQAIRDRMYKKLEDAKRSRASRKEIDAIEHEIDDTSMKRALIADGILIKSPNYGKVGAFEGAGYQTKGLYRPMVDCIMFSKGKKPYCKVCQKAVEKRILFYCK
jgi:hypothetical protein